MEGFGSDTFDLSPRGGLGSTVLSLAVKKEANLDYEKEEFRRLELTVSYCIKQAVRGISLVTVDYMYMTAYVHNFGLLKRILHYCINIRPDIFSTKNFVHNSVATWLIITKSLTSYYVVWFNTKPGIIGIARVMIFGWHDLYSQLIASDAAGNDSLTRTATVIVNLRDKNDNSPIFSDSVYDVLVGEEVQPGSVIANVSVSKRTAS